MAKKSIKKKNAPKTSAVDKIINKGNWFMVEIIERMEPAKVKRSDKTRLCTVWGNWHLIKAQNAEKAYAKAEKLGKSFSYVFTNSYKEQMRWEFVGIGDLLPIYEDIEDKAELMWSDFGDITAKRSEEFIPRKSKLMRQIKPKSK